jgi:hypothetical protein
MCKDIQLVGVDLIKVMLMFQCVVATTSSSLGNQQIVVEGAIGVCNGITKHNKGIMMVDLEKHA